MGRGISVKIGSLEFSSKKEAQEFVRDFLRNAPHDEVIYPDSPHFQFLRDLIELSPWIDEFIEKGILSFRISENPMRRGDYSHILYRGYNNYEDAFSWKKCIGTRPVNDYRLVLLEAMRCDVIDQTNHFRNTQKSVKCSHCGTFKDITVDHKTIPFSVLAKEFIDDWNEQGNRMPMQISQDCETRERYFQKHDNDFSLAWYIYHKDNADFQLLCRPCNSSKGTSPSQKPTIEKKQVRRFLKRNVLKSNV